MEKERELHHIGIATENIETSKSFYSTLFPVIECSETVYDALQHAKLCMLTLADGMQIELIEGEVVMNYVRKRNFLYHTCFLTDSLEQTIEQFMLNGAALVSEPKEAVLFGGKRVAFLMTEMGLVELLERD